MKDYFNAFEKETHLKITCCQTAVAEMLATNAISDEERSALETAGENLKRFSTLVYGRLGAAYKRKLIKTAECNAVKLVGRYAPAQSAVSHCAQEDFAPCFEKLQLLSCWNCDKCNDPEKVKDCAVYNMGVALDIEGGENGCPYKMADGVEDFLTEDEQ